MEDWFKRSVRASENKSRFAKAHRFEEANNGRVAAGSNPPCNAWGGNVRTNIDGTTTRNLVNHPQLHVKRFLDNGTLSEVRVILDDALVDPLKYTDEFGDEYYRIIYHDSKLTTSSPWTGNQRSEIMDLFKNDESREFIEFEVRNNAAYFQGLTGGSPFANTNSVKKVRIYRDDVYKSVSNGDGVNIEATIQMSASTVNFD